MPSMAIPGRSVLNCMLLTSSITLGSGTAEAVDIKKALAKPVSRVLISSHDLYDIERCLIQVDGPTLPIVYRQPDRPEYSVIAYSAGLGVPLIVEIERLAERTEIRIRTSGPGIKRIPEGFLDCV